MRQKNQNSLNKAKRIPTPFFASDKLANKSVPPKKRGRPPKQKVEDLQPPPHPPPTRSKSSKSPPQHIEIDEGEEDHKEDNEIENEDDNNESYSEDSDSARRHKAKFKGIREMHNLEKYNNLLQQNEQNRMTQLQRQIRSRTPSKRTDDLRLAGLNPQNQHVTINPITGIETATSSLAKSIIEYREIDNRAGFNTSADLSQIDQTDAGFRGQYGAAASGHEPGSPTIRRTTRSSKK
ncbi:MAG: hypothetical protein EZS28_036059 [Streblomastix strix]|uniref:Uncharacterized protein n=1 Tax=Streblomastix strix TaxID=222440 RepID=A0A5J4UDX4_9EUKA|nr:MAG: hypothetical protein EZS28_036059 [Streblomastix strix]